MEKTLLELFAPTRAARRSERNVLRPDQLALWRSDAIHRAKNLAQLSSSLASIGEHRDHDWLSNTAVVNARALARAYDALGDDDGSSPTIPCATLLCEVASRLVLLFGQARRIATVIEAHPVSLEPDRQRALVLICSELVINALKYGFPGDDGGLISIRLEAIRGGGVLTVEDDGTGTVALHAPGHGSALMRDLAGVLGATIGRRAGAASHGYSVAVSFDGEAPR